MSDGIYKIVKCDRCGFEVRIPKEEADKMCVRLPDGWGWSSGKPHQSDLCPMCLKKYNKVVEQFMREKE